MFGTDRFNNGHLQFCIRPIGQILNRCTIIEGDIILVITKNPTPYHQTPNAGQSIVSRRTFGQREKNINNSRVDQFAFARWKLETNITKCRRRHFDQLFVVRSCQLNADYQSAVIALLYTSTSSFQTAGSRNVLRNCSTDRLSAYRQRTIACECLWWSMPIFDRHRSIDAQRCSPPMRCRNSSSFITRQAIAFKADGSNSRRSSCVKYDCGIVHGAVRKHFYSPVSVHRWAKLSHFLAHIVTIRVDIDCCRQRVVAIIDCDQLHVIGCR
jgi:hypothetical protein